MNKQRIKQMSTWGNSVILGHPCCARISEDESQNPRVSFQALEPYVMIYFMKTRPLCSVPLNRPFCGLILVKRNSYLLTHTFDQLMRKGNDNKRNSYEEIVPADISRLFRFRDLKQNFQFPSKRNYGWWNGLTLQHQAMKPWWSQWSISSLSIKVRPGAQLFIRKWPVKSFQVLSIVHDPN